jgi:hypothetical protein
MYLSLKAGTVLFRGMNNINNIDTKRPLWLCLDKESALLYGNTVIEYKLLKDVTLLNIQDLGFHSNYLNVLNLIYKGTKSDGVDNNKIEASIPIGLPDLETQYKYLISKRVLLPKLTTWTNEHEIASKFLLNRHRYSTFERDKFFVDTLNTIYGKDCHGYISPIKWPSKLHDGLFNTEVCLFSPTTDLIIQNKKAGGKNKTKKKDVKSYEVPEGDSWNRMNKPMSYLTKEERDEIYKNTNIDFVMENLNNLIRR